jgi:cystathionine beta-lyase/cystathionine gamma-synthase
MLRLSVGIEHIDDILEYLSQALEATAKYGFGDVEARI